MQAISSFHLDGSCSNSVRGTAAQNLKEGRKYAAINELWERSRHNRLPFGAKDSALLWLSVGWTRWPLSKCSEACLLQRFFDQRRQFKNNLLE